MEVDRIVDQMKRAHIGTPWTGVSLADLLDDATWKEAAAAPIPGAHSIWEIALHLVTAQQLIVDLVQGISRPFRAGDDWPTPNPSSEASWDKVMGQFRDGEAAVRRAAATVADEQLDRPFREGGTSAYNNLHGYTQHAVYHAGQISMLKKLVRGEGEDRA